MPRAICGSDAKQAALTGGFAGQTQRELGEAAHVLTAWLPGKEAAEESACAPVLTANRVGALHGLV
jgi:hypothetical protein